MITIKLKIVADGSKYWLENDKCHRDNDQPAIIFVNGQKCWYQNGKQHRDNDQPVIIFADGTKCWYQNGKFIYKEKSK